MTDAVKDSLTPLAPPPPSAEPVVDATIIPEKDPRHLRFEKIKKLPDSDPKKYISLAALIEEFIAAGHNPRAPDDVMFQILGVTPEFLEGLLFALKGQAARKPAPVVKPQPVANDPGVPEQVSTVMENWDAPPPKPDTATGT